MKYYKKQSILIISSIIISALFLTLGVTYSYYAKKINVDSFEKMDIVSSVVNLDININSGGLTPCKKYPILNEEAVNCEPLIYTLTNNNEYPINYTLQIERLISSNISADEIKVGYAYCGTSEAECADKNYKISLLSLLPLSIETYNINATGYYLESKLNLQPREKRVYKVITWIDYDNGVTQNQNIDLAISATAYTTDSEINIATNPTVTLELNGGSIRHHISGNSYPTGTILNLEDPISEYGTFDHWEIDDTSDSVLNGNTLTVGTSDVIINSVWVYKELALTFNLDGGELDSVFTEEVRARSEVSLPNAHKTRYMFRGWQIESGNGVIIGDTLHTEKDNIVLRALWEDVAPVITYTGEYNLIYEEGNDWKIKFLTTGTLTFNSLGNIDASGIDVFLVGGGGGGGGATSTSDSNARGGGSGGGGGYTNTQPNVLVSTSNSYTITVGTGGAGGAKNTAGSSGTASSAFGYTAKGGIAGGCRTDGGAGGSGGGGAGGAGIYSGGSGGTDGGNGGKSGSSGGKGQGTTTREFGEDTGYVYSGGGGGGYMYGSGGSAGQGGANGGGRPGIAGTANTGGGGGGGNDNGGSGTKGGSGIVIIRNHR